MVSSSAQAALSSLGPIRALQVILGLWAKRACWRFRAALTRSRIWAEPSPVGAADNSRNFTWLTHAYAGAGGQNSINSQHLAKLIGAD